MSENLPATLRQRQPVESAISIMDTAKFEHLGRIAAIMADAGLMPESLTCEGPKDKRVYLPDHVIKARAFLICVQADRWNMDPLAVMGCCSLVHNQLMYEGKLVHAVIEARLGTRLDFQFGRWDSKRLAVQIGVEPQGPADEFLGIVVSGILPGDTDERTVEGYVGQWKTAGTNSPWTNAANWKRQLRYRGSREWANAHSPGIVLGVLTDDDLDAMVARTIEIRAGARSEPAPTLDRAFGERLIEHAPAPVAHHVARETQQIVEPVQQAKEPAAEGDDPLVVDGIRYPNKTRAAEARRHAAAAAKAKAKADAPKDEPKGDGGEPVAAPDGHTREWFVGDTPDGWTQVLNQTGAPVWRRVGEKEREYLYERNDRQEDEQRQGETTTQSPPTSDDSPAAASDDAERIEAFNTFGRDIAAFDSWLTIKRRVAGFMASDAFKGADIDLQDRALLLAYNRAIELNDPVRPTEDPLFYRVWLRQAEAAQIEPVFGALCRSKAYRSLAREDQDIVIDETTSRTDAG